MFIRYTRTAEIVVELADVFLKNKDSFHDLLVEKLRAAQINNYKVEAIVFDATNLESFSIMNIPVKVRK